MSSNDQGGVEVSRRLSELSNKARQGSTLPEPEPLDLAVAPPPFPVDALPGFMADMCLGTEHQLQMAVDMPAMVCLGVLSAAVGGRVDIEARPGWREPLNLYLMSFSDPASRKTAVVKALSAPLRRAERRLRELVKPRHLEATARQKIAKLVAEKAVQAASQARPEDRIAAEQEAVEAQTRFAEIVVPPLPTILSEDSTPESLVGLMAENHGRAAVIAAETDALDTIVGRYAKGGSGANLGIILKAHSGESHKTRRVGRASEDLPHTNLTLMLMGQPAVLTSMVTNAEWTGRGVLARLLISVPDETVGYRTPGTEAVDPEVALEYSRRIEELVLDLAGVRVHQGPMGHTETLAEEGEEPQLLTLSPEADDLLLAIETEVEPQLREDGRLGGITGWGGKLAGATVRLAGLLHLVDNPIDEPVSDKTMERAWSIASYFSDHALIAFRQVGITGETDARKVLDYLHREKPESFTVRDLHNALKGSRRFREVAAVLTALGVLEEKGWVARKPAPTRTGPGRKPSPAYAPHPNILK